MTIADRIRKAREQAGLTQMALGELLGYKPATAKTAVYRWEAGTRPVPMDKIKPLAEVLKIPPDKLLP